MAAISSQPEGAPPAAAWNTYIWVENADETAAKVRAEGGRVLTEPFDVPEAGRMAICAWLAGDDPLDEGATRQVYDVCEGFLCPSLGTRDDYASWITSGA